MITRNYFLKKNLNIGFNLFIFTDRNRIIMSLDEVNRKFKPNMAFANIDF